MNMKLKVTFIIIITLVLGIVVGFMLNRTYSQRRVRNIISRRSPEFFVTFYERILEPDTKQSKMIREILDTHAKQVSDIRENYQEEVQSLFESVKAQIDPILTPEQKERLKERFPRPSPYRDRPGKKRGLDKEFFTLKERLHLSEEQTSQIQQIFEDSVSMEQKGALTMYRYVPPRDSGNEETVAVAFEGPGLWGPVKGFLALDKQMRTIRGITI